MATRPDMHVGDYGTIIDILIINRQTKDPLDLSSLSNMYMLFEKPSGNTFSRAAVPANAPGTDGILRYTIQDGDIDETGRWNIQAKVQDLEGLWHTDILEFFVGDNIIVV